jgi:DNA-binding transcriptional ArsR family regulator
MSSVANKTQVGSAENHQEKEDANVSAMTPELQATIAEFRKHLDLTDPGPLLVALATVAANRIDGDPVWLLEVGPPSSGKTEVLQSLTALSDIYSVGQVTEAGLLSGSSKQDAPDDATGGLLIEIGIGGQGIILFKDFGSILSLNSEAMKSVLAAFREIFDGEWTRKLGTDGGKSFSWHGKVGAIGGVTEEIERHHSVMSTLGERFLFYRIPRLDDDESEIRAEKALNQGPNVATIRLKLKAAVHDLFKNGIHETDANDQETDRTPIDLAMVVVSWRSSVIRDGNSRDVLLIPGTEVPTRIAKNLQQLQRGFRAIGLSESAARKLLVRVGLDSIPLVRGKILRMLIEGPQSTSDISERLVGYSRSTVDRHLAEVRAHRGVEVKTLERGQLPRWILPDRIAERLTRLGIGPVSPEKSETVNCSQSDVSTARVGSTESLISEMSESGERERPQQLTHQTKPVGTES